MGKITFLGLKNHIAKASSTSSDTFQQLLNRCRKFEDAFSKC